MGIIIVHMYVCMVEINVLPKIDMPNKNSLEAIKHGEVK